MIELVSEEPVTLRDIAEIRDLAEDVVAAFRVEFQFLRGSVEIHHIGATALPFGHTKGDVDVNVRVDPASFADSIEILSPRFAIAQPQNWTPTFASFTADRYQLPLGIQVTATGSADDFLLSLRDTLRLHPDLLRRYDEAKLDSAGAGAEIYWQAKDRVLKELLGH